MCAHATASFENRWQRMCPDSVEVRPCVETERGNGLFACKAFEPGENLFEEDPLTGTAILLFDESRAYLHCAHCTLLLPLHQQREVGTNGVVVCPRGCTTTYCSQSCCDNAWRAHHEILCTEASPDWGQFLDHALECSNEYYVLAARVFASLRHEKGTACLGDETESFIPWAEFASPPWWHTMRRPAYSDSSDESEREASCASNAGLRSVSEDGQRKSSCCSESSGSQSDRDKNSLDSYFVSKIQEQTQETVDLLRQVLRRSHALTPCVDSLLHRDSFAQVVGLLRVNSLSVRAGSCDGPEECVRGMGLYPVMSAMNHCGTPNCFAASDPVFPQRAIIRCLAHVAVGEELCIDYLAGAPYDADEREGILHGQYSIPVFPDISSRKELH